MCGIAGFIKFKPSPFAGRDAFDIVSSMLAQIRHRGPDEAGAYADDTIAMGTVRLSIIDLAHGQQPMTAYDRYVLCFNGEIFNYIELREDLEALGEVFSTRSDTEVVLRSLIRWGADALLKFDGHFAIAFYDRQENRLVLARDPFGEKPLFYSMQDGFFAFGSEVKAFRPLPGFRLTPDRRRLGHTAWFWTPIPGGSVFENVDCVRPGHFMAIEDGVITQKRYFDFPALNDNGADFSYAEAQEQLRALLDRSIRRRLRSDVEVASYLSGGLDSTIVTCLAREIAGRKLKTFSVAFDHEGYDESSFQQSVADRLETEHYTVRISSADIVENFGAVLEHAETAVFRTALAPMYLLSRHVRDNGIKVVLTGEGADEFFMGYDIFKETLFREHYDSFPDDDARIAEILGLYPYLPHFNAARAQQLLSYFKNHTDPSGPFFSHDLRFANGTLAAQLLAAPSSRQDAGEDLLGELEQIAPYGFGKRSKLSQAQILDIKTLLEGYLLSSQGDRMTSANSIEGRCPFLSLEIVDFAQGLPLDMKLAGGVEKKILRDAFADKIPQENALRRKQPYRAPDASPFIADKAFMQDAVLGDLLANTELINADLGGRLVKKLMEKDPLNISPREDQAFIFMLSSLMLEQRFCRDKGQDRTLDLKVKIDDTTRRKIA